MRNLVVWVGTMLVVSLPLMSQGKPEGVSDGVKALAFEVVSIKPNNSGDARIALHFTPVGFTARNVSFQMIIQEAFGLQEDQIYGEPDWVKNAKYDVEAKVGDADVDSANKLGLEARGLMLRPVLVDRLQMKYHNEMKSIPVLALVVAKGGPKLASARSGENYPSEARGPDGSARGGMVFNGPGQVAGQAVPISSLVQMLTQQHLGRAIIDDTGLAGIYDFELSWDPEEGMSSSTGGSSNTGGAVPGASSAADASRPSIFSALQAQLGLKLEPRKSPAQVLVIDQIEKPSVN